MSDSSPPDPNDPWLTLAEIAEELRVSPATVRLWVSQGKLGATRAGRRKLLVRRSALDQMLKASEPGKAASGALLPHPRRPAPVRPVKVRSWSALGYARARAKIDPEQVRATVQEMQQAAAQWDAAIDASENAPPDPGFVRRLRAISKASERQAKALRRGSEIPGFTWTPLPEAEEMILSHELRPGGSRPGPARLWQFFDMAVERLSVAMQGDDVGFVAQEYEDLADVLARIAAALEGQAEKRDRPSGPRRGTA